MCRCLGEAGTWRGPASEVKCTFQTADPMPGGQTNTPQQREY